MAHAGPHLCRHLHRLWQQSRTGRGERWTTWKFPCRGLSSALPVTGTIGVALLGWLFSIYWYMGLLAVVMSFFLAAVAARAGAEIGINPIGALGKVTQLTYGVALPPATSRPT